MKVERVGGRFMGRAALQRDRDIRGPVSSRRILVSDELHHLARRTSRHIARAHRPPRSAAHDTASRTGRAIAVARDSRDNGALSRSRWPAMNKTLDHARFSVAYYSGNRKTGTLTRVRCEGGEVMVTPLPTEPESALDKPLKPVLVGMSEDGRVILLDPRAGRGRGGARGPAGAGPAHIYQDPQST